MGWRNTALVGPHTLMNEFRPHWRKEHGRVSRYVRRSCSPRQPSPVLSTPRPWSTRAGPSRRSRLQARNVSSVGRTLRPIASLARAGTRVLLDPSRRDKRSQSMRCAGCPGPDALASTQSKPRGPKTLRSRSKQKSSERLFVGFPMLAWGQTIRSLPNNSTKSPQTRP